MRISDWSSDVCSSDLSSAYPARRSHQSSCASPPHSLTGSFKGTALELTAEIIVFLCLIATLAGFVDAIAGGGGLLVIPALLGAGLPPLAPLATNKRSAEHTSELQSLMRTSYLVCCLQKETEIRISNV